MFLFSGVGISSHVWAEEEIIVSAASSLTSVMKAVQKSFEASDANVKLICNFASSGSLLQQIKLGAPVDIYLSASDHFMDRAEKDGLIIKETRTQFAANRLVLIVPAVSPYNELQPDDLKKTAFKRIAIGNPKIVPAGLYAKNALVHAGIREALKDKFIFGNSVRQVLDYTMRGEVDAGFVYATDAIAAGDKVKTVMTIENTGPVNYPVAVTSASGHKAIALKFTRFVKSKKGASVLAAFGFNTLD